MRSGPRIRFRLSPRLGAATLARLGQVAHVARATWLAAVALTATTAISAGIPSAAQAAAPFAGATVQVNQDATTRYQNEPTIAINPTNPRNLVAGSIDNGQSAAYASTDRGRTWTHQVLPNVAPFTAAGDPVVAVDAQGTAYYLSMNCTATCGSRTQYVFRSTDTGKDWLGPTLAIGSPATDDDKGAMAVDDHAASPYEGNVYVAATRNPGSDGDLRFARSTDGGASFQLEQQVDDNTGIAFSATIAIGIDGAVYVAWAHIVPCASGGGCTTAIMIDKSTDGGASFGALSGGTDHVVRAADIDDSGEIRPEPLRGTGHPTIGTDPFDPNVVYAVWAENPAGVDDSDVMFSRSLDGGNTWTTPIRVNDDVDPPGEFFSQYFPTLAVDPSTGEIDVVWYSDQNDPDRTDGTPLVDAYFASSTDGGLSFGPSIRVSTASSDPSGSFNDYIGIDSLGGVAHPIWTDTTLGGEGDQDIATTEVGGADLRIAKTDLSDPVAAGTNVEYTITVTNDGPADGFNGIVTDTLPAGVTFVPGSDPCSSGPAPGTLTCYLDKSLPAGASDSFDITLAVAADLVYKAGSPVTLTNTATVRSDQTDPDPSDNTASETTLVRAVADAAVVSFAPVAPPAEVLVGRPVDVTLRKVITNHGPSSPVDVVVSRTATAPPGSTVTPTSASSTAAAVASGELRTIDETFTLTCGAPGVQTFFFGNSIQLASPADTDPDSTNDTSTASVMVECVLPVAINVKPGGFPNAVNLKGAAPVAVLTTRAGEYGLPLGFDATTIDPTTVRFGPASVVLGGGGGATEVHGAGHPEDSYELDETTRDGDLDLVLHFRAADSGLTSSSTEACVAGTFAGADGIPHEFFGCDSIKVVP
jgi:uncharacterized repeat protein (TIGR01451 family)